MNNRWGDFCPTLYITHITYNILYMEYMSKEGGGIRITSLSLMGTYSRRLSIWLESHNVQGENQAGMQPSSPHPLRST